MDIQEIRETPIWGLYERGRNYHRLTGIYTDTDRNYRMYNGNQWEGAKLPGRPEGSKNAERESGLYLFSGSDHGPEEYPDQQCGGTEGSHRSDRI